MSETKCREQDNNNNDNDDRKSKGVVPDTYRSQSFVKE